MSVPVHENKNRFYENIKNIFSPILSRAWTDNQTFMIRVLEELRRNMIFLKTTFLESFVEDFDLWLLPVATGRCTAAMKNDDDCTHLGELDPFPRSGRLILWIRCRYGTQIPQKIFRSSWVYRFFLRLKNQSINFKLQM